jgi:hypothetical protein
VRRNAPQLNRPERFKQEKRVDLEWRSKGNEGSKLVLQRTRCLRCAA